MHVKTERIGDDAFEIEIDATGIFRVDVERGESIQEKTLEALLERLKKHVAKAKAFQPVEVTMYDIQPITKRKFHGSFPYEHGRGTIDVLLRGWSERRRAPLVTIEGKKHVLDDYNIKDNFCRRFTQDETLMYEQLAEDVKKAEAALEAFLAPRRIPKVQEFVEAQGAATAETAK